MVPRSAAEVLRELREKQGRSLRAAASDLGVAPSHLSRIERGQRSMGDELAGRLTRHYGLGPDETLLLSNRVPADIAAILLNNPQELARLRQVYSQAPPPGDA